MFVRVVLLVLLVTLLPRVAEAQYMDPGATSLVVQLVIAGVVGFATVLKLYWKKLTGLVRKRASSPSEDPE